MAEKVQYILCVHWYTVLTKWLFGIDIQY